MREEAKEEWGWGWREGMVAEVGCMEGMGGEKGVPMKELVAEGV